MLMKKIKLRYKSFSEALKKHPCHYWQGIRQLAIYLFARHHGCIPYCRKWRFCQHCYKQKFQTECEKTKKLICQNKYHILAITIDLPFLKTKVRNRFLSNVDKKLKRLTSYVGLIKKREVQHGWYNVHYALITSSKLDMLAIEQYLRKKVAKLYHSTNEDYSDFVFCEPREDDWIDYCYKLWWQPSEHVPCQNVAKRVLLNTCKNIENIENVQQCTKYLLSPAFARMGMQKKTKVAASIGTKTFLHFSFLKNGHDDHMVIVCPTLHSHFQALHVVEFCGNLANMPLKLPLNMSKIIEDIDSS